jgi:RNAse (barnase) inhibitor barstar
MMKLNIVIDGSTIQSTEDFHVAMKNALQFPEYYGMNPDALWDSLSDALFSGQAIEVVWTKYKVSVERMGGDAEVLRKVLVDAQNEFPTLFKMTIEN